MIQYPPSFANLISALRCLPGVGTKSAQRMALHLMERNRSGADHLAQAIEIALERLGHCQHCRNLAEDDCCDLCRDSARNAQQLCIVETPADVFALEQATHFRGRYFVLMGRLSPLDGIGPEAIGLDILENRLQQGEVQELILATNPTVEGEATAYYLAEMGHRYGIRVTRIAHGVPMGGELEHLDGGTLSHALNARQEV